MLETTIANGESLSSLIELGSLTLVGIEIPAGWTAANLTLQTTNESGGTLVDVYDKAGSEYTITVGGASRFIVLDKSDLQGIGRFIKLRSGTSGTPVNQGADRVLKLIVK